MTTFVELIVEFYLVIAGVVMSWSFEWGGLGKIFDGGNVRHYMEHPYTKVLKVFFLIFNVGVLRYVYWFSKRFEDFSNIFVIFAYFLLFLFPFTLRAIFECINCCCDPKVNDADKKAFYAYRKLYVIAFVILALIHTLFFICL